MSQHMTSNHVSVTCKQEHSSSVEHLSVGAVSRRRPPIRVGYAAFCGPCDLGECSLVLCCSLQNLHGVFGCGLQCLLGPEDFVSGNILVSKSYNFFNAIGFADF